MYNFDKIIDRRNTDCTKFDQVPYDNIPEDNVPLWIADMDFESAPSIMEAVSERASHGIFGYSILSDRYYDAIMDWHKKRFGTTELKKENISYQNSGLAGICHMMDIFSNEGDAFILFAPVYPGFFKAGDRMKRKMVTSLLTDTNGYFSIDFNDFEEKIKENDVKFFIFCNPHNPAGRVWTKDEVTKLVDICLKYGVKIIDDELWSDVVLSKDVKHTPLFTLDPRAKDIGISLYSPSKAFNLGGMISSYSICYNQEFKEQLEEASNRYCCNLPCMLAIESTIAAYNGGEEWLEACLEYIRGNIEYVCDFLKTNLPKIKCVCPESSYLLWLDFTDTGMTHEEMLERTIMKAGVICNDGHTFGDGGEMHMRFNPTTARANLEKAMALLLKEYGEI